jgi:spore coat polysaccharide biosynthesis protein SpsF
VRIVAIVQARMTSTRLPGKVLLPLAGRPMLARQLQRLRACRSLDEIVVATTTNAGDDAIVELARGEGIGFFRGSEHDVLSRYARAARAFRADLVVRITSDCPLIDPTETGRVVDALRAQPACDYASNVLERTLPRGLDTEALFRDVLERVDRLATSAPAREHVTFLIHRERPELFVTRSVTGEPRGDDLRWTVDTPEDYALVRRLYDELGLGDRIVGYPQVLAHVRGNPALASMNQHVAQKA